MSKTPNFASALASTATPVTPKTKKPRIPVIDPPAHIKTKVDKYQEEKAKMKQAKGEMDLAEVDIITLVSEIQDTNGFAEDYHGSYAVKGKSSSVTVVFADKFSVNPDDEAEIRQILGENYTKLFGKSVVVKLKDEVLISEELQNKLMELVGENFGDFFETHINIVPLPNFKELVYRYTNPKKIEKLRVFVKQNKPSLR